MSELMQFDDGEGYEAMMGVWSALVGKTFLDWLDIPPGARWADIGCGNGASTELIVSEAKPEAVEGLDPSEAQLAFARLRHRAGLANYKVGSALQLPYEDDVFDVAIMALVIFFVSEPARAVSELVRVVRPGGTVAAYAWDIEGGGFPYEDVHAAMRGVGVEPLLPPRSEAAGLDVLEGLWSQAGLIDVETRELTATRVFSTFDDYWSVATSAPGIAPVLAKLSTEQLDRVSNAVLGSRGEADFAVRGRAHAVRGRLETGAVA